jgi:hypothetical protein
MSLESATTIAGLVATNPASGDAVSQGDDHLRLLKAVLKAQFPGAAAGGFAIPITATEAELNYVHGVKSAIQTQLNGAVPIGTVVAFWGIVAPTNWCICDGTNGTPDLRGRFIMGSDAGRGTSYVGGSADAVVVSHTHNATSTGSVNLNTGIESVDHGHTFTTGYMSANNTHAHTYTSTDTATQVAASQSGGISVGKQTSTSSTVDINHVHTGTTDGRNTGHVHNVNGAVTVATIVDWNGVTGVNANLPPFVCLIYIMRYQ